MISSRPSQLTIIAVDLPRSVAFYREAFGVIYREDLGAFQFGDFPDGNFFLLTVAHRERHPWPGGPVQFGLAVDDVDRAHARALESGAVEISAPRVRPWSLRSSTIRDPGGNHVDLYLAASVWRPETSGPRVPSLT